MKSMALKTKNLGRNINLFPTTGYRLIGVVYFDQENVGAFAGVNDEH